MTWLAAIVGASTLTPGGKLADRQIQLATEIGAVAQHQDRLAVALGHGDRHHARSERDLFGVGCDRSEGATGVSSIR